MYTRPPSPDLPDSLFANREFTCSLMYDPIPIPFRSDSPPLCSGFHVPSSSVCITLEESTLLTSQAKPDFDQVCALMFLPYLSSLLLSGRYNAYCREVLVPPSLLSYIKSNYPSTSFQWISGHLYNLEVPETRRRLFPLPLNLQSSCALKFV